MLTIDAIRSTESDDRLFELLGEELERRLPNGRRATDEFVQELQELPPGLRAMAATYELDVSLTLDDICWHFGNWPHVGLSQETLKGLRELGAIELADMFEQAFSWAKRHWNELQGENWSDWYNSDNVQSDVRTLTHTASDLYGKLERGIFTFWLTYARAHPECLL